MTATPAGRRPAPDGDGVCGILLTAYTAAVDAHDYEGLVQLFTPDARVHLGRATLNGRSEIAVAYRSSFASSRTTKHLVTNIVTVDATDRPQARAYLFVTGLKGESLSLAWGSYDCTARLHSSRWLIEELSVTLDVPFLRFPVQVSDDSTRKARLQAGDLIEAVSRYLEALERFDLEEVSSCFTEDAFYSHPPYSPEDNGGRRHEARGRTELVALFQRRGRRAVKHEITHGAIEGSSGFVEGVFTSGDVHGSFVSSVTLTEDGRIRSYAAYSSIPGVSE
jgi:ketosteroid isomerase-like protein